MFGQIEKTNGDFSYNISVYRKGPSTWGAWDVDVKLPIHKEDESDVSEMIEQVKGMNPDKELRIFYSKW